ncbi:MAG: SMI1/KNR4 family protein [Candidatus Thiodiazotropha weberae]|nr:SMI1/KNR4 family protein [Candidatus Thiodiazotropha lotti]MCG8010964.1 SMI1/KNR4 family protein [Candidatus Thiodiazotropha lotti]MCW4210427.1 SMI1/KNR4 family protein [Candidatus Thiodiazotropha lotti]MCW4217188.1 SMI1/KNR4 family protein [Candidatus Thiodiazotropha lotti]
MKLEELFNQVTSHEGEFICEQINNESELKVVTFKHDYSEPVDLKRHKDIEEKYAKIPKLIDFYHTFGSLRLYVDEESEDSGRYIAAPDEWEELEEGYKDWIDMLEEEELEDFPSWIEDCLVIGETPQSGNYILIPLDGEESGCVYEFDHDGFELTKEAENIEVYIGKLINIDSQTLTNIASHMRFIESDPMIQWWIRDLKDNKGVHVSTRT